MYEYYESCPDCDSINTRLLAYYYAEDYEDTDVDWVYVECEDCGSDWQDEVFGMEAYARGA